MTRNLLFIFILLGTFSCNTIKTIKVLNTGSVAPETFKTEVPFEYRMELMIIKVQIKGKTYDFLVDTGAPNVVSKELAAELQLEAKVTKKTGDSQGGSSKLDFVTFDTLSIGNLQFMNTGAAVADLKQSNEIACLKIDGFIGANLMKQAIWQIDYDKQVFTIVSSRDQLTIPAEALVLPFKPATSGTPKVALSYNNTKLSSVTFDTGSNGSFSTTTAIFDKLLKDTIPVKTAYGFGRVASGLYGNGTADTVTSALIDVKIGETHFPNQVARFNPAQSTLLGNDFLKHFRVIIDWSEREIMLIQNRQPVAETTDGYGISPVRSNDKLIVGFLFHGSDAEQQGIQVGDTIARVDDQNYLPLTDENWCELLYNKLDGGKGEAGNTIVMEILRNGERKVFTLKKRELFN